MRTGFTLRQSWSIMVCWGAFLRFTQTQVSWMKRRDGSESCPFMIQVRLLTVANCALHICARYYNNVCPKKDSIKDIYYYFFFSKLNTRTRKGKNSNGGNQGGLRSKEEGDANCVQ